LKFRWSGNREKAEGAGSGGAAEAGNCGAVELRDIHRLLSTPSMMHAVSAEAPAAVKLRKYAGFRTRKKLS